MIKMSVGKKKLQVSKGGLSYFTDIYDEMNVDEKKNVKGPLKILKKDDRKIGILKNENDYYLRDFDGDEMYGCHTVEYPSLKLAEKDARYFLRNDEEVVTSKDVGLCNTCDSNGCSFVVNCEDWKSNQVIKAIKREGGR